MVVFAGCSKDSSSGDEVLTTYPEVHWGNVLGDSIDQAISGDMTADEVFETTEKAILDTYEHIEEE